MSPEAVAMRDKRISSLPAPSATSRGEMVKKVQIPDRISSLKRSRLSRQSLRFWSRRFSITSRPRFRTTWCGLSRHSKTISSPLISTNCERAFASDLTSCDKHSSASACTRTGDAALVTHCRAFSQVSALVCLLCKVTVESVFSIECVLYRMCSL